MTTTQSEPMQTDSGSGTILRTISGYCMEWNYRYLGGLYGNDVAHQFAFMPGCFDQSIQSGRDIALTMDLDGKTIFARTGDGSLQLTSDDVGLLVEAELRDTPQNRMLCQLIDSNRVRGWSHQAQASFFGRRIRTENGVEYTDHHQAGLAEVTLVVKKVPRQKTRKTPIFLSGGPARKVTHAI